MKYTSTNCKITSTNRALNVGVLKSKKLRWGCSNFTHHDYSTVHNFLYVTAQIARLSEQTSTNWVLIIVIINFQFLNVMCIDVGPAHTQLSIAN